MIWKAEQICQLVSMLQAIRLQVVNLLMSSIQLHWHIICIISVTGCEYDYLNAVWDWNSPKIKLFQCTANPRATGFIHIISGGLNGQFAHIIPHTTCIKPIICGKNTSSQSVFFSRRERRLVFGSSQKLDQKHTTLHSMRLSVPVFWASRLQ